MTFFSQWKCLSAYISHFVISKFYLWKEVTNTVIRCFRVKYIWEKYIQFEKESRYYLTYLQLPCERKCLLGNILKELAKFNFKLEFSFKRYIICIIIIVRKFFSFYGEPFSESIQLTLHRTHNQIFLWSLISVFCNIL